MKTYYAEMDGREGRIYCVWCCDETGDVLEAKLLEVCASDLLLRRLINLFKGMPAQLRPRDTRGKYMPAEGAAQDVFDLRNLWDEIGFTGNSPQEYL